MDYSERVVIDPDIMAGKPVIKGTRVPVELIVKLMAQTMDPEKILNEYPRLTREDIRAALEYAGAVVSTDEVYRRTPLVSTAAWL